MSSEMIRKISETLNRENGGRGMKCLTSEGHTEFMRRKGKLTGPEIHDKLVKELHAWKYRGKYWKFTKFNIDKEGKIKEAT